MNLSVAARKAREHAIERAIVEVVGEEALDDHPDLPYALDELLASEDDGDAIVELAEAAGRAQYADEAIRSRSDRSYSERSEAEEAVDRAERQVRDALNLYVEERVEARIEDAIEWLDEDVTLDDVSADEEEQVDGYEALDPDVEPNVGSLGPEFGDEDADEESDRE